MLEELFKFLTERGWRDKDFHEWYAKLSKDRNLDPNPYDRRHFYDYNALYNSNPAQPTGDHLPSQFKLPGHPRYFLDGVNTTK